MRTATLAIVLTVGITALLYGNLIMTAVFVSLALALWYYGRQRISVTQTTVETLPDGMAKCMADYKNIQISLQSVRDEALVGQIQKLQRTSAQIMEHLRQNPQSLPSAGRFIDYYQDRAASILRQYVALEQSDIRTEETERLMEKAQFVLFNLDSAYEKQYAKVLGMQFLDMDAEMTVLRQNMENDGIVVREMPKTICPEVVEDDDDKGEERETSIGKFLQPRVIGAAVLTVLGGTLLYNISNRRKDGEK